MDTKLGPLATVSQGSAGGVGGTVVVELVGVGAVVEVLVGGEVLELVVEELVVVVVVSGR